MSEQRKMPLQRLYARSIAPLLIMLLAIGVSACASTSANTRTASRATLAPQPTVSTISVATISPSALCSHISPTQVAQITKTPVKSIQASQPEFPPRSGTGYTYGAQCEGVDASGNPMLEYIIFIYDSPADAAAQYYNLRQSINSVTGDSTATKPVYGIGDMAFYDTTGAALDIAKGSAFVNIADPAVLSLPASQSIAIEKQLALLIIGAV